MTFNKYSYSGTWLEALHIFLYDELLLNAKPTSSVELEGFISFQLTDKIVKSYNDWVDNGTVNKEIIFEWFSVNKTEVERFRDGFGKDFKSKVELWSDRNKNDYYKEKLQLAFEFENYLANLFKEKYDIELGLYLNPEGQYLEGENKLGIEIKYDNLIKKYGNLYIEYSEKSRAENKDYVASGILKRDKSNYFLIGDYDKFWIFRKARLVEILHEERELKNQQLTSSRGIVFKIKDTSLGFVYPVINAEKEALSLDTLVAEIRQK